MEHKRLERGFTILEVLIAIAIFGIIITIILSSVSVLQRHYRNHERKNDASTISSERLNYDAENGTTFPTSPVSATCASSGGAFGGFCTYLVQALVYYDPANVTITNNGYSAPATIPTVTTETIISETHLKCNNSGTAAISTGTSAYDAVVIFAIEDGRGGQINECLYTGVVRSG